MRIVKTYTVSVPVRMTPEMKEFLEKKAAEEKVTVSEIVRLLVDRLEVAGVIEDGKIDWRE